MRSELLRARSRRIVWMLLVVAIAGILLGVVIAMANSDPAQPSIAFGELPAILEGASFMLGLLGVVLGASLAGADWAAGTMATLLVWEPRRFRVFLVRAAVAALVVTLVVVAIQAFFTVAWLFATSVSGTTEVGDGFVPDVVAVAWRVAAVAVVFALVGHAVASLGRSTFAGVGILVGYAVIVEGFVAGFAVSVQPWMLIRAATVVVSGNPLFDPRGPASVEPGGALVAALPTVLLSVGEAWLLCALYVGVIGGLALLAFRARDVQ